MESILQFIKSQAHSQIVGGGLVLMLSGALIALIRNTPVKLWAWLRRRITLDVEILNSDPLFGYVTVWLDSQPYSQRTRNLSATTRKIEYDDDAPQPSGGKRKRTPLQVLLSPAVGYHVFFYGNTLVWLNRNREKENIPTGKASSISINREAYSITILGRNQDAIRRLIQDIVNFGIQDEESITLYTSSWGYWKSQGILRPRKMDSVVLPAGVAEGLLADTKKFLGAADWYRNVGIPWHRGYLLYGIPGGGKTSLVSALAGELGMDLYMLSITGSGMDDEKLSNLMSEVRPGTIVLMEDVDCSFPGRDSDPDRKGVTLSGLLNCLDGVHSTEGCIIFMTTNFIDRIDAALLRPGRVDKMIEFRIATTDQIVRLRDRLDPRFSDLSMCEGKTMAEVQQILLDQQGVSQLALQ